MQVTGKIAEDIKLFHAVAPSHARSIEFDRRLVEGDFRWNIRIREGDRIVADLAGLDNDGALRLVGKENYKTMYNYAPNAVHPVTKEPDPFDGMGDVGESRDGPASGVLEGARLASMPDPQTAAQELAEKGQGNTPESLVKQAISWSEAGPGKEAWDAWLAAADSVLDGSAQDDYSRILGELVNRNRVDGLSSGEWADWLREVKMLEANRNERSALMEVAADAVREYQASIVLAKHKYDSSYNPDRVEQDRTEMLTCLAVLDDADALAVLSANMDIDLDGRKFSSASVEDVQAFRRELSERKVDMLLKYSGQTLSEQRWARKLASSLPQNVTVGDFIKRCDESTLRAGGWTDSEALGLGQLGAILDLHVDQSVRSGLLVAWDARLAEPERQVISSRTLAAKYPVKGSMPHAVVHQLYQLREAEVERLSQRDVIKEVDLHDLDRGARAVVAGMLFGKCDDAARHALLHDEHAHVRSAAAISQSDLEEEVEFRSNDDRSLRM
ncbi:hypothetical protein DF026_17130 [Burkholderia stagnalis]|nr:hypothetical protein DF025_17325 [Burkholderia stagnalis]RQR20353.1 hypothetical protein DF026_17130 [Burkholderia stagnalis]